MSLSANHPARWTLLWLRRGPELSALRRQLQADNGHLLELSPWRIVPRRDDTSRQALAQTMACQRIVFTSPAAVTAANALMPLAGWQGHGQVLAVGAGTARALRRAGIDQVQSPERMDSEGLLALAPLQCVDGLTIGLVTAPEGRGVIPATLRQRGAQLHIAEVYDRRPRHIPARQRARLCSMALPAWLALGSGKALEHLWQQLSPRQRLALAHSRVIPASARLADQADALGLVTGLQASSAMVDALLDAVNGDRLAAAPTLADPPGAGDA